MLKVWLKQHRHFFKLFFVYEHVNIFIVIVYISGSKTLPSFMLSLKKNNYFLSFYSSIFHSKKFISILHVKWTGMNKGEQVKNLNVWVNILFEWLQSLFAATKIYILIFNLTYSLISLMGSFNFPQWKIFFPIHCQIYKALGNGISQSFILILHFIFNSEA